MLTEQQVESITCADLRPLANSMGIACKDTVRLFWGTYGYYVKTFIPPEWVEDRVCNVAEFWEKTKITRWNDCQPSLRKIHKAFNSRVKEYIEDFIEQNADAFDLDQYYYQITAERVTFYLKAPEAVRYLLENNPKFFSEMSLPKTTKVEERLSQFADTHMEVRETNWWGKFDYKIDFKAQNNYDDVDERVGHLYLTESFYSVGPHTRTLFLQGEDEYFLVKLALKDKIAKVTACVLNSDAELEGPLVKKHI